MRNDAFKRRLAFSFTVIILAQNNFLLLVKPFITTVLEYKAILKLQKIVCVAMHFLVISPYSCDFLCRHCIVYLK